MILAIGKTKLGPLIDGLIAMAASENEKHELNGQRPFRHGDGWGIAYYSKGWKTIKSTKPVYNDNKINILKNRTVSFAVLHARKASKGKITLNNTHPFRHGQRVFCHNGMVYDSMDFPKKYVCKGNTDSERLFYFILSALKEGKEKEGIRSQLAKLKKFSGVNFILASPTKTFVAVKYSESPKYFTMKLGKKKGFTIVSSERLPIKGMKWKALKNGTLLEIQKPI